MLRTLVNHALLGKALKHKRGILTKTHEMYRVCHYRGMWPPLEKFHVGAFKLNALQNVIHTKSGKAGEDAYLCISNKTACILSKDA